MEENVFGSSDKRLYVLTWLERTIEECSGVISQAEDELGLIKAAVSKKESSSASKFGVKNSQCQQFNSTPKMHKGTAGSSGGSSRGNSRGNSRGRSNQPQSPAVVAKSSSPSVSVKSSPRAAVTKSSPRAVVTKFSPRAKQDEAALKAVLAESLQGDSRLKLSNVIWEKEDKSGAFMFMAILGEKNKRSVCGIAFDQADGRARSDSIGKLASELFFVRVLSNFVLSFPLKCDFKTSTDRSKDTMLLPDEKVPNSSTLSKDVVLFECKGHQAASFLKAVQSNMDKTWRSFYIQLFTALFHIHKAGYSK